MVKYSFRVLHLHRTSRSFGQGWSFRPPLGVHADEARAHICTRCPWTLSEKNVFAGRSRCYSKNPHIFPELNVSLSLSPFWENHALNVLVLLRVRVSPAPRGRVAPRGPARATPCPAAAARTVTATAARPRPTAHAVLPAPKRDGSPGSPRHPKSPRLPARRRHTCWVSGRSPGRRPTPGPGHPRRARATTCLASC